MLTTNKYHLKKPEGTDQVDIQDFNDNADIIDEELGKRPEKTGDASNMTNTFTRASSRTQLVSGESLKTSLGKIMKWFADLKTVAFTGKYTDLSEKPVIPSGTAAACGVVNNLTTTVAGYVLDARQGKVLKDEINTLNGSLGATNNNVAQLQQNIANIMPGSTYIDIPNPYTAGRDGWAFLTVTGTNEGHVGLICSNGFSYTQPYLKKDAVVHMYIPVRKGQTVSFNGLNFTPNIFRFY